MEPADRVGHPADRRGFVHRLVCDWATHDELGHQVALRADECHDLGPHTHAGRGDRRRVLDFARDPQEMRVVAGQADDVAVMRTGRLDQEVPVRDPAGQRPEHQCTARQVGNPLHRERQIMLEFASQLVVGSGFSVRCHETSSARGSTPRMMSESRRRNGVRHAVSMQKKGPGDRLADLPVGTSSSRSSPRRWRHPLRHRRPVLEPRGCSK